MAGFGTCKRLALVVWSGLEEMREGVAWSVFCVCQQKARSSTGRAEPAREAVPGYTWIYLAGTVLGCLQGARPWFCWYLQVAGVTASSGEASDPDASTMQRTGLYCR